MSKLSADQAINEILLLPSQKIGRAEKIAKFNQVISQIEPGKQVTDRKFTFWSGGFSPNYQSSGSRWKNISSNLASTALAQQSDHVGIIRDTNYATVLNSPEVKKSYLEIKDIDPRDKQAILDTNKEYSSGLNGPWAQASQSLAENVRGDVLAFTPRK